MLARLVRSTHTVHRRNMKTAAAAAAAAGTAAHAHASPLASSASSVPSPSRSSDWRRRLALLGLGSIGAAAALYSVSSSGGVLVQPAECAAAVGAPSARSVLTHAQVYAQLSSPVEVVAPVQRGIVSEYHSNQFAANPSIEDTVAVVTAVSAPPGGMLVGVFDGHSGRDASRWCSEELLPYLQYYRYTNRTDALVHKRTFVEADHHFLELALRDKRMAAGLSGACVNVAHISGRTVRTANAGDCRTIVGRRVSRPAAEGADATAAAPVQYQAVELTTDHQIDTNHLERERLLRDHPNESDIIRKDRVKGRLQPTRGFGDGFYKRREFYTSRNLAKPYAQWSPPYTTAEPDITSIELQPTDDFLVMASDGLFSDLNSQQVVEYVGEWLSLHRAEQARRQSLTSRLSTSPAPTYCPNASTYLIRQALVHASERCIGRRSILNENMSWVLQVPIESKRNVHDDVSVVVVFFDHNAQYPADSPVVSPTGPAVPPTLARALNLHLKAPHAALTSNLPRGGITPIKIAPIQEAQSTDNHDTTPIRANL